MIVALICILQLSHGRAAGGRAPQKMPINRSKLPLSHLHLANKCKFLSREQKISLVYGSVIFELELCGSHKDF